MSSLPPAQPDAESEERILLLLNYLQQHRAEYPLVALRKQLLDAGHPNTLVDEALRRLEGGGASRPLDNAKVVGVALAMLNVAVVFAGFMAEGSGWLGLALIAALLIGELAAGLILCSGQRAWLGRVLIWGAIWSVVGSVALVALAAVLIGVCIAVAGGPTF